MVSGRKAGGQREGMDFFFLSAGIRKKVDRGFGFRSSRGGRTHLDKVELNSRSTPKMFAFPGGCPLRALLSGAPTVGDHRAPLADTTKQLTRGQSRGGAFATIGFGHR
jgi:hypothetical protein